MRAVAVILALASVGYALCPGGCSGHGQCKTNDQCVCQPNWIGPACGQRQCPFGSAFADSPLGDLDHDGTVSAGDSITGTSQITNGTVNEMWQGIGQAQDEAHFYAECSGKGTCDRASGECGCFDGYTGHACQRTECPSGCSGHGVCRTLREIAANGLNKRVVRNELGVQIYDGVQTGFTYNLWDADKAQACICDSGYTGFDCSMRDCPRGDDPLTTSTRWHGNQAAENSKQKFTVSAGAGHTVLKIGFKGWDGRTQYAYAKLNLNVDSPGSISSSTPPQMPGTDTTAGKIMLALRNLPSGVLSKVTVTSQNPSNTAQACPSPGVSCIYIVEFDGRPGKQDLLTVSVASGGATIVAAPSYVTNSGVNQDGNKEEITCSGRGLCDYSSGLCECFAGYYGASCENQNALAGSSSGGGSFVASAE